MFKKYWTKFRFLFKTRRPFKLTRPGWVYILYTIGLGAGAINTGNNLLYLMFGLFLGLIMASGVLSDLSLWGIRVSMKFPDFWKAQHLSLIGLRISNQKKWISSVSVRLSAEGTFNGGPITIDLMVPFIEAQGVVSTQMAWTPQHRGRFEFQRLKLLTRFPFGLLLKWWVHLEEKHSVLVTPALYPVKETSLMRLRADRMSGLSQTARGEGSDMRGLRPYSIWDHYRRIHWKASAKKEALASGEQTSWMVKEFDAEQAESIQLDWPSLDRIHLTEEEFERFVSFSASVIDFWMEKHRIVQLRVDDVVLDQNHLIQTFLALVSASEPSSWLASMNFSRTPFLKEGADLLAVFLAYEK